MWGWLLPRRIWAPSGVIISCCCVGSLKGETHLQISLHVITVLLLSWDRSWIMSLISSWTTSWSQPSADPHPGNWTTALLKALLHNVIHCLWVWILLLVHFHAVCRYWKWLLEYVLSCDSLVSVFWIDFCLDAWNKVCCWNFLSGCW